MKLVPYLSLLTMVFLLATAAQEAEATLCPSIFPDSEDECYIHEQPTFITPESPEDSFLDSTIYVRLADDANVYAEPSRSAAVVRNVGVGFLFATVFSIENIDGTLWYQINYGEYVHQDDVSRREISQFRGVEVMKQPERPFGWIVQDVQPSELPDGEPDPETEELVRYTFFEVYDSTLGEDDWVWYQLEDGRWIRQTYVSLVNLTEPPEGVGEGEFWTQVDLYEQTFAAYEGERMVFAALISSGLNQWPTYEGFYQVGERFTQFKMSGAEGQPDYYFLEDVPHIMYFDFFNGIALHGAYWHDRFGYKASHGCVNMPPYVAEWVFNWSAEAPNELWVNVYSSDPLAVLDS